MIGKRFHYLVVKEELERIHYATTSSRRYLCICDCGNLVVALPSNLHRGATKSCGCWKKEHAPFNKRTHGMSYTDEYKIWAGIHKRCTNPSDIGFHRYGGKGIAVCERWNSFENFFADMGPRPSKSHSIDRKSSEGNYEPSNCRWATPVEQGNNTSRNVYFRIDDETLSMRQLADRFGIHYHTISSWRTVRGLTSDQIVARLIARQEAALNPGSRRPARHA